MKQNTDLIIVGSGIAGCVLAWQWMLNGKSVIMISDLKKGSSAVAAGVYNPTILKRFTSVWKSDEQLVRLNKFYPLIEAAVSKPLIYPIPILRRFHDASEIKTWTKKSQKDDLKEFMVSELVTDNFKGIDAPFGYGKVTGTGWIDTIGFMDATVSHLMASDAFVNETFDYKALCHSVDKVHYKEISSKKIVFAEGIGLGKNPYFQDLPLQGNKGEVLTIKVPGLKLNHIIKSSVFLMPYTDDLFWVGATYERDELSDQPTETARGFLTSRLERFLKLPYEIVDHKFGIRPTTQDRRPFVGSDDHFPNYLMFNGMGSRAVLMAPWAAQQLFDAIYSDQPIDPEMDIARFV